MAVKPPTQTQPAPHSIDHIARGLDLAALVPPTTHPEVPPLFVVNCQLPDSEPAMFGAADDGPSKCLFLCVCV